MKIINLFLITFVLCFSEGVLCKIKIPSNIFKNKKLNYLHLKYKSNLKKKDLLILKKQTLKMAGKSVPVLTKVMKSSKYPDTNRWMATFLLGRIMGIKAAPFIVKFMKHPSWIMRMASLKTLLALKVKKYGGHYAKALKDKSLIVRIQALENINTLGLKKYGSSVWAMLYDEKNYYNVKKVHKRTNIIKKVIKVVGNLDLKEARKPLLKMIADKKYNDIFKEMDYALAKLTNKKSPSGSQNTKRIYWQRLGLRYKKF